MKRRLQAVQKPRGHPANKAHPAIPAPHLVIPAKAGIQHMKRALRAPLRCRGRKKRGIPAFAGMTEKKPGMTEKKPE